LGSLGDGGPNRVRGVLSGGWEVAEGLHVGGPSLWDWGRCGGCSDHNPIHCLEATITFLAEFL